MGISLKHDSSIMALSLWESRSLSDGEGFFFKARNYRDLALEISVGEPPPLPAGG